MSVDERARLSLALGQNLYEFLLSSSLSFESMIIGVFAPFANEPDWTLEPRLRALKLAFPHHAGELSMSFHLSTVEDLVLKKEFGVKMLVPNESAPKVQPDLVLVPGLGFSKDGHRLGRGGGYYDRWLESFEGKKIGLCFEAQLLQELPTESHDVVMDLVITEKRVLSS